MDPRLSNEGYVIESLFRIADKEGNDVDFVLNSAQRAVDVNLGQRNLIPKARQEGVSSYFLARSAVRCLSRRNTRAVVISHDQESTQRLLTKVRYYIKEIKGPAPEIHNMSANEITFPKTNSMFYIGTAGSRKFGRGDTITDLHCSEYAFWPNPKELMAGLLQAVPKGGFVSIESTGNGLNDYYHRCMRAAKGETHGSFQYKLHFLPWHTFEEYTEFLSPAEEADFMAHLDEALDEDKLRKVLTPGQLAWRRGKIEELDYDVRLFKQEYPMTLDECFQMTGESVFHRVNYEVSSRWQKEAPSFHVLKGHPNPNYHYVQGADPSGGVGKDSSVIEVLCLETMEQVGEWVNNRIDPEQFAYKLAECGKMFNNAYTVVESNNHGLLTVATLDKLYPSHLIHRERTGGGIVPGADRSVVKLGHRTTARSKPLMIGELRAALANEITIHSYLLNSELSTFIEHEGGKLAAQDGCFDDTVMAMACANLGRTQAGLSLFHSNDQRVVQAKADPFTLDGMIEELTKGRGGFPIAPQHKGAWN